MELTNAFSRYEELKAIIAKAEVELDELKPTIVAAVPEGKEVEGAAGVFTVQNRATWTYSKDHEAKKNELKTIEEEEKAKGIATAKYTPVLYYKPNKPNEE